MPDMSGTIASCTSCAPTGGEERFVNVTEQLRSMKRDGRLFIVVGNRSMGGDPDPWIHKVLRVLYWHNGQRRQIVVPEHAELRLP